MILYLCVNKSNHTTTAPAIAESYTAAMAALKEVNPENISDLVIYELCKIDSLYDLFLLDINPEKELPSFLNNRSDDSLESSTRPSGEDAPDATL